MRPVPGRTLSPCPRARTLTINPKPQPESTVQHARKFIAKLPDRLAPNNARSVSGCSFGLMLAELALGFVVRLPASLLPTVVSLTVVLVSASPPAFALVPERLREVRRGLTIAAFITLVCAVALTAGTAMDSARQSQRATHRCLTAANRIAGPTWRQRRAVHSASSLRSGLAALGVALCDDIAAGRS